MARQQLLLIDGRPARRSQLRAADRSGARVTVARFGQLLRKRPVPPKAQRVGRA
jgi:hypothetical protein